jgi:predicted protein tyrosine phosphatase
MTFDVFVSSIARDRLATDLARVKPTHVMSLLDPGRDAIDLGSKARHLTVRFRDHLVRDEPDGFGDEHLSSILKFTDAAVEHAKSARVRLLVHCHHGQSRSPAVAYVALAVALGRGKEQEAFDTVIRACISPWPNRLIVEAADTALARRGDLVRPLADFQARFTPPSARRDL